MLTFEFFNAAHGDAFLVRWGGGDRVMLVDGGPSGNYEARLKTALEERLPRRPDPSFPGSNVPHLEIVYLSHVDDDHAAGLVRLARDLVRAKSDDEPPPFAVDRLWFNAVEEVIEQVAPGLPASVAPLIRETATNDAMAASYNQGRDLRDSWASLGKPANVPFGGPLIEGMTDEVDGLSVTVVGPGQDAMDDLAKEWRKAKTAGSADVIVAAYDDKSIPNLSSIVLHVTEGASSALLTGDARGDFILSGLRSVGLLTDDEPMHVDVFKLPHHGSVNNMEPELFELVQADHYVASANGKHGHPSVETLEAIVASRADTDDYSVHLTNPVPHAVAALDTLKQGRSFQVDIREDPRLSIEIEV